MEIYIDIFFLVNFSADFLLLILSDLNVRSNAKAILKKLMSSAMGSAYACLFFLDLPAIFFSPAARLTVLAAMCAAAFCPCPPKLFFKKCVSFFAMSLFLCGAFYAFSVFSNGTTFPPLISDGIWLACLLSAFLIGAFLFSDIKKSLFDKGKLKIKYNGKSVFTDAVPDSGNSLKYSLASVIVVDGEVLKRLFSESVTNNNLCEFVNPRDFRTIPYKTISQSGIICGFVPQKIIYNGREIKEAIVAVAPSPLSCGALISPKII